MQGQHTKGNLRNHNGADVVNTKATTTTEGRGRGRTWKTIAVHDVNSYILMLTLHIALTESHALTDSVMSYI